MLKILRNLGKREWGLAAVSVGFIVLQVWLELTMPDYMQKITMLVQTPGSQMSRILREGGMMLLCALGSLVASVAVAVIVARIATNFGSGLRARLFSRVQDFSPAEMGRFSTASLITRSTNDITQVQILIVMGLQVMVKAPITAAWAIGKISAKNQLWTLSTGVAVGTLLVLIAITMLIVMPRFKMIQQLTDDLNRVTRENLNGIRVVRAYNAEDYQEEKFSRANDNLTNCQLHIQKVMATMMPGIQLIMSGLSLSIYWVGAYLIHKAGLPERAELFANMVTYLSYAIQVVMSFMMLVIVFIIVPRASVSAKRINEVLDTEPGISDGSHTEGLSRGEVEFRNVSFSYNQGEEPAIRNISFKAEKGQTVALIGATGSGKTTVINLIPRFYDPTEGQVLVDGRDVRQYRQEALRNKIGYVSQKAVLFSGTVASNVSYGSNSQGTPTEEDIAHAIAVAQAAEFVEEKPDTYESHVAQGGTNFSGGQKQRLSIARAIARKPEIFIFDDSFSALDYRTDRILRDALKTHCADATKIIVAQRIGTIRDADCILVLDEGELVGRGTHKELMTSCEVYRQIAYSQLSKEELE
ncbi:MAG: ABC transporter ATP-binding protein [Oscillospiraceae bacterium]|nr:ABC transporter ATP-binding protein [Oscillospiraceae bacterium]